MVIPKIEEQDIIDALKYIDENGVPFHNQSTKYELVSGEGKKYPPKYVIAVAAHIANGGKSRQRALTRSKLKTFLKLRASTLKQSSRKNSSFLLQPPV